MKRMLLAVFSALYLSAFAQITVTSATFPAAGDTLKFAFDTNPQGINVIPNSGVTNFLWDFSTLNATDNSVIVYKPALQGMFSPNFPGAELVVIGQSGETFFNLSPTKFEVLGYAGADPANFGVDVNAHFTPAYVERKSPMNFFDINEFTTNLSLPFSTDQLPDSLFAGSPVGLDSIRVLIETKRLEVVDGWGTCKIPGGQYPVLRQKRTEYQNTGLEVHVTTPFPLGWVNLSTFFPSGGGPFGSFLGADTTITYRFISGTDKEEIAVATMKNDLSSVESVQYKDNGVASDTYEGEGTPGAATIQAYPNPAVEWVRFDCSNLPQDDYTLKIYNIIGKVVWKENYNMQGAKSIRLELDSFKKGTYLYSLIDSKGNVIGTKRLVIIKP